MIVYVTYFRYDRGETYSLYHIDRNKTSSIKHFKEEDLPNFLGYGPDDVSQLYLVKCKMDKSDYEFLKEWKDNSSVDEYDVEFYGIMEDLHDTVDMDDILYSTTGDENFEVLEYFCNNCNPSDYLTDIPEDEDDLKYELQQVLFDNDSIYEKILKEYINRYY